MLKSARDYVSAMSSIHTPVRSGERTSSVIKAILSGEIGIDELLILFGAVLFLHCAGARARQGHTKRDGFVQQCGL